MKEQTTYVTGASGFLGSYLTSRLDSYIPIPHRQIPMKHFSDARRVFFLSTYGNMAYHDNDDKVIQANVSDLIEVVRWIDWEKIESFVFISSSSVKRRVQTIYSRTKKAAEEILMSFMDKYNAPISIIRPLSITGVGEQQEHLIPKLIDSCLHGTAMPFVKDAYHDYIDVEDVTDGILKLSDAGARGVFELGTGSSVSNQEVKELVEKITGKKANTTLVDNMRKYDDKEWVSTNLKARGYGWMPKKTLEQSIKEMVEYARNQ